MKRKTYPEIATTIHLFALLVANWRIFSGHVTILDTWMLFYE